MTIGKDIVEAIGLFLDKQVHVLGYSIEQGKTILAVEHREQDWTTYESGKYAALNKISTFDLLKYLINDGYS